MNELMRMVNSFNGSISLLNKSFFEEQSLYLLLAYLDQLGWLISPNSFSNGLDFQNWLDRFCNLSKVGCTSADLWNTRCSLLHMGTAESKHFKTNKHVRLAFYQNIALSDQEIMIKEQNYPNPTKWIDIKSLYECINEGIEVFLDELEVNVDLRKSVLAKCEKRYDLLRL